MRQLFRQCRGRVDFQKDRQSFASEDELLNGTVFRPLHGRVGCISVGEGAIMSLEQLFLSLERRVFDFGRKLWPADPAIAWREEAEELCRDLHDCQIVLEKRRHEAKNLRRHVLKQEVQATVLASHIETCVFTGNQGKAWDHALELDRTRAALQQERRQLSSVETTCHHLERAIGHRERRLGLLQEKLSRVSRLASPY
ncbi:MAG: hypothetical protein ACJ8FY_22205 [Gemmataceae bacterium]